MQNTPKIRTQSTFPAVLTIDGVDVDVRVKRMTKLEYDAFEEGFAQWGEPRGPEETPEALKAREAASEAWLREALDTYLAIVPGVMEHDGREITKGGELLDIYGGRADVVPVAIALILGENRLSEAQKKTYKSALGSLFGSWSVRPQTASGDAPAPIVAGAEPRVSVAAAGVTDSHSDVSSGTTVPSDCAHAPCAV